MKTPEDRPQTEWIVIDCPVCRNNNRAARRRCGFCDKTGKAVKQVPVVEESVEELLAQAEADAARVEVADEVPLRVRHGC